MQLSRASQSSSWIEGAIRDISNFVGFKLFIFVVFLMGVGYIGKSPAQSAPGLYAPGHVIVWRSRDHGLMAASQEVWRHGGVVKAVAFSRDGKYLATGSADKTGVLRSTVNGEILHIWRTSSEITSISFSHDSQIVVTGSANGSVVVRDVVSGAILSNWQHVSSVRSVSFSPDGREVLVALSGDALALMNRLSGETVRVWGYKSAVNSATFSPDGRLVLAGLFDHSALVFDKASGKVIHQWTHSGPVYSVAFSPDGMSVVSSSADGSAVLRRLSSGAPFRAFGHKGTVNVSAFSPDGRMLLTGSADRTVALWEIESGRKIRVWDHALGIESAAFSPDGSRILTGSWDHTVVFRRIGIRSLLTESLSRALESADISHRALPSSLKERQTQLENAKPIKDEFESTAQFNARVVQWNKTAEALNAEIQSHYNKLGPLPLNLRAKAFEEAIANAYGNPELQDIRYDPETARFFATLKASLDPDFKRTISIPVLNDQARAAKQILESDKNGLEIELRVTDRNELIWGQPRVNLNGRTVLAQYTDKDFVPPSTSQVASVPSLQTIAPPPMATINPGPAPQISTDPNLAKLQIEVLQREREQAEAAARQAEEKRLRDRLAELNRAAQTEFKDDLPTLLAKLPTPKPNPRVHVLAIGINDYADVPDVPFADRSAQQFADIAQRLFGAQKQNVIVLTNAEATSGRLRGRIRTLLNRLGPQDQLLLYYAGHGVPGKDGSSAYLLAQDGGPGSYEEPDLQLTQLYTAISQSKVGKAKVFIDACFSGRSGKDTIVFEGIAPITVSPKQSFPDSARLAVLTAGRGDQFSNQDKDRGHRLFGYHLMRVLIEEGPKIEVAQLHQRLRDRVLDDSRRIGPEFEQEPELQGNGRLAVLN